MGNFDNYYIDENGNVHRDIPLGTSPADAYVRTNMKLKKEVQRIDNAIQETKEHIEAEISHLDEEIVNTAESVSRQIEGAVSDINESIGEVSDSIDTRIATLTTTINNRVDNIIAHNNDTSGNTELIDIRIGADEKTYATAGNAVRVNIGNLKSAFDSVTVSESEFAETNFDSTVNNKYISNNLTEGTYNGGIYGSVAIHTGEKYKIKAEVGVNIRTYVIADANGIVTRYADTESFNTRHNYDVEITVSSSEDGGTLYVSSIAPAYFGLKKETKFYVINKEKIPNFPKNPLLAKTALFDGDSICAGLTVGSSHPTYGYGWAGRIGTKNNMTWKNYGISGGTVATDTYNWTSVPAEQIDYSSGQIYYRRVFGASATDTQYVQVPENEWDGTRSLLVRGNARHWEATSIDAMYAEYPDADYVILESCLNDGFNDVPKGTVISDDFSPASTTTFTSAMEYMINRAITLFPNAKIGVIIPHREYHYTKIEQYNQITRTVCEKWGIPYIDLYKESGICFNNATQKAVMFADNTHLTAAGYDMITDKIEAWMKTL